MTLGSVAWLVWRCCIALTAGLLLAWLIIRHRN